jgi:sugar-specific transcriptional regulator TrmB
MSKLLENKQIIHIASEIVILLGLTFYFNQKNKKLLGYIEDLSQRVEEQEDLLQKHEEIIKKLVEFINNIQKPTQLENTQKPKVIIKNNKTTIKPINTPPVPPKSRQSIQIPVTPSSVVKQSSLKNKVTFQPPDEEMDDEEDDLDAELSEELEELNDQEEDMEEFGMD